MEKAASESNETKTTIIFYCHICNSPQLYMTDSYKCPTCNSGFIENINTTPENQNNIVPPSTIDSEIQTLQQLPSVSFGSLSSPRNVIEYPVSEREEEVTLQDLMVERDLDLQLQEREFAMQLYDRETLELSEDEMNEGEITLRNIWHARQFGQNQMPAERRQVGTQRGQIRVRGNDYLLNNPRELPIIQQIQPRFPPEPMLFMDDIFLEHREIIAEMMFSFSLEGVDSPLTGIQIDRIPTLRISQEHLDVNLQCYICLELFGLDEEVLKLICNHMYHKQCITPWITRHATCPVCRQFLLTNNDRRRPTRNRLTRSSSTSSTSRNSNRPLVSPYLRDLNPATSQESGRPPSNNVNRSDDPGSENYDYYDEIYGAHSLIIRGSNINRDVTSQQRPYELIFNNPNHQHSYSGEQSPNIMLANLINNINEPANINFVETGFLPVNMPANSDNMESGGNHHRVDMPDNTGNVDINQHGVDEPANTRNVDIEYHDVDDPIIIPHDMEVD